VEKKSIRPPPKKSNIIYTLSIREGSQASVRSVKKKKRMEEGHEVRRSGHEQRQKLSPPPARVEQPYSTPSRNSKEKAGRKYKG